MAMRSIALFVHRLGRNEAKNDERKKMKVLTDVTFGSHAFTWDHLDPFYSTNGQFDPSKLKAGVGSMRIDMTKESTELITGSLKHVAPIVVEDVESTYIVGPGE